MLLNLLILLKIILWIIFWYCIISFIEYYLHFYHMHRNGWLNKISPSWYINHQRIHHPTYKKNFSNATPFENAKVGIAINWITILIMISPIIFLFYYISLIGAISLLFMSVFHSIIWTAIHEEMHIPRGRFFSSWRIYKFLYIYHFDHHMFPNKNFNVVYPLADFILGTYHHAP